MRIAVCLAGQFRKASLCKDNILNTFYKDKPEDVEIDFFAHTWTYSRYPYKEDAKQYDLSREVIAQQLEEYFHPKAYLIEDMPDLFKTPGGPEWRLGQFYTISKSLELRRKYEEKENIEYDYVFFCRFDQFRFLEIEELDYPERSLGWDHFPKPSEIATLYNWFRSYQWVQWDSPMGHWILADFSWFCNRPAANKLEKLYDMFRELVDCFKKGKTSSFWTSNNLFYIPEKYLGLFCYVNDINIEVDQGVYQPGVPIRDGVELLDLKTIRGRRLLSNVLQKYGFRYGLSEVQEILQNEKKSNLV